MAFGSYEMGLLPAVLLSLLFVLVFANSPHIGLDDAFYLKTADNILRTPLDPFSTPYFCEGSDIYQRLVVGIASGPVTPYYIALVKGLFGDGAAKLHLAFYLFYLIAVYSVYDLAYRTIGSGTIAALIFAANPFVLESSLTVLADLPVTALFLLSIDLLVRGVNEDSKEKLLFSGIAMGIAMLTKYTALSLLLLFVTYLFMKRKLHLNYLAYLSIPVAIFFLWWLHNMIFYGSSHFISNLFTLDIGTRYDKIAGTFSSLLFGRVLSSSISTITFLLAEKSIVLAASGVVALFPLMIVFAYAGTKRRVAVLAVSSLALVFVANVLAPQGRIPAIPVVLSFVAGIFVTLIILLEEVVAKLPRIFKNVLLKEEIDKLFLAIAIFVFLAAFVFKMPTFIPRYGLPMFALFSVFFADKIQNTRIPAKLLLAIFASFIALGFIYVYPTYSYASASKAQADLDARLYSRNDTFRCDSAMPYGLYLAKHSFKLPCLKGTPIAAGDKMLGANACSLEAVRESGPGLNVSAKEVNRWYMGPGKDVRYTVYTFTEPG